MDTIDECFSYCMDDTDCDYVSYKTDDYSSTPGYNRICKLYKLGPTAKLISYTSDGIIGAPICHSPTT